jgi:flagellar hook-length control protein FliK
MQTMLKVFDIGSMGNLADVNSRKIAIRVNSNDGAISDQDEAGFMESLRKFLSTADERKVKSSLEELEWIPIDGEGGLTPVIDFTDGLENTSSLEALIKSFYDIDSDQIMPAPGWQDTATINEGPADDLFVEMGKETTEISIPEGDEKAVPSSFNKLIQSQSHPKETDDAILSENKTPSIEEKKVSAFDGTKQAADEKKESVQGEAAIKRDSNTTFSNAQESREEMTDDGVQAKSGEAVLSRKPVENPETGKSNQPFQIMDKEKQAGQTTQRTEKQDTPAFQRMFADDGSSRQDPSASFQNDTSNSGNQDPRSHLSRVSQTGTETQLHVVDTKSADAVQSAESGNTQPAQKTPEDDVIRQIVQRMTLRNSGDQSRMTIQLKPEFLGNLKLEITTENQHVAIRMTAESSTVKEIIEHNISVLKSELQHHKLNVDKIDVYVGQDNQSSEQRQQEAASWQGNQENMRRIKGVKKREEQNKRTVETPGENTAAIRKTRSREIDFFA